MEYEVVHVPQKQQPQSTKTAERLLGQTAARAGESLLGLPGDILSTGLGVANAATSWAPQPLPTYSQVQQELPVSLPTSSQVRSFGKELTGGSLEPQGEAEQIWGDVVGDLATFLLPVKGKIPFKSALVKAFGGNAASWFTKQVGGGEGAQVASKIGFNLLSGLKGGREKLTAEKDSSLARTKELSSGKRHNARGLKEETNKILDFAESGTKTDVKDFLTKKVSPINDKIRNNSIPVVEAVEIDSDLKSLLRDPKTPEKAIPYVKKVSADISDIIKDYGNSNKDFAESYRVYNDIETGLNEASRATKFLNDNVNIGEIVKSPTVKGLFLGGLGFGGLETYLQAAPFAAAGAGAAYGLREGSKALDLFRHSAEARKYYAETINAALKGNAATASRNLSKLDNVAVKYESNEPEESAEYEVVKI